MKKLKEYLFITFGIFLVALSIEFFLVPNSLAAGGVSGIAIIVSHYVPALSVGALVLIMNVFLFIVAFIVVGNKFGAKTIYASLGLSAMLWAMDNFMTPVVVTRDLMLAAIFGTFMSGIGMAIVFNQNASTGGTDILAKILSKFIHMDIGKALLAVDFIVTFAAVLTFGADKGLYALLAVLMNGFMIDFVIDGFNKCKEIMIISSENEKIREFIIVNLERGCTFFNGVGGFSGSDTRILYTVLSRREFIKLKRFIREVDCKAFITVSDSHEVLGEGFKDIVEE